MMRTVGREVAQANRIIAALEAGNDVVGAMIDRNIQGAKTYNTIKRSLSYELALHLARLFDSGSRKWPKNKSDIASIPLMVRLLRQKRCKAALAKRARETQNALGRELSLEQDSIAAAERASEIYTGTFKGVGRPGSRALRSARDTFLAHSLIREKHADPKYGELFYLFEWARQFAESASLAINLHNLGLEISHREHRLDADRFWHMALNRQQSTSDAPLEWAASGN